jgi:hypothetical protein
MKRRIIILIYFCIFCGNQEISEFKELRVIAGDKKILIQWEFSPDWQGPWDSFSVVRSSDKKNWVILVSCYPIDYKLATYRSNRFGQFLDTMAENEQKYFYRVSLVGLEWGSSSEIVSCTPKQGLPNPRPSAPSSFRIEYSTDTTVIIIKWAEPKRCDGLYYYTSSDSNSFDWTAYEFYDPLPLRNQLAVRNRKDGSLEYYKFIALVDGILSEPSEDVLVEHKE